MQTPGGSIKGPLASALALMVGAGVYALVEGPGGVTFFLTPLMVGAIAVGAGLVGTRRHLVGSGLGLAGWGVAVLIIHYNTLPGAQTTPVYMLGVGIGVLAAGAVAPKALRAQWMVAAGTAVVAGGLGLYLADDHSWAGRWTAWCVTLIAWGLYEAGASVVAQRRLSPAT